MEQKDQMRSVSGLGRWLVTLLALGVVADAIAIISGLAERELFARIATGVFSMKEVAQSDSRQAVIGMAQLSILLITTVVFLIWFHRAYKNLLAFGAELPHGTGWAIGAWFVPILNLFRPKGIADAIWQASDPQLEIPVGTTWSQNEAPIFLHVWWVTWILSTFASRIYDNLSGGIDSVAEAQSANTAGLIANGLAVITGVLAIMFVKGATNRQETKAQQLATFTPPLTDASASRGT